MFSRLDGGRSRKREDALLFVRRGIDCFPSAVSLSLTASSILLPSLSPWTPNSNTNAHRVTDLDRAILQLKTQRRLLEGAAARTSRLVEREREAASSAVATGSGERNRQLALAALRRKKLHEIRLATVDSYLLNVESALAGIDDARATASVASALRSGADALKSLRASTPLAEVDAILEDSRAAAEYEASMATLLADAGTGLDASQEESVEKELEALVSSEEEREAREEAAVLPEAPGGREAGKREEENEALPSAPTGVVAVGTEEKEVPAAKAKAKEKEWVPVLA